MQNVKQVVFNSIAVLGLTAAMTLAMGCSGGGKTDDGKVHLQLSTWGSAQEIKVTRELLAEFELRNQDIDVELIHIPDNYYQKLHILIAGGMAPDVIFTNSINFPVYALHDVFMDLTPYLDAETTEAKSETPKMLMAPETTRASDFYDGALKSFTWTNANGEPSLKALPRDISNLVVFYNRDLFDAHGVPVPNNDWGWNQLVEVARELTLDIDKDGRTDQFGISFYSKPPLFWLPFVWSAGGDVFSPDYRQFTLGDSKALQGIGFYRDLRNYHHVAPTKVESGSQSMSEMFLQQKLAMMISGRWSVPVLREQAKFKWDVLPLPVGPGGYSRTGVDASGYAVATTTKHPKESFRLAAFLISKKSIEKVTESGLIVPARRDVAQSPVFLNPKSSPAHSRVFLDVLEFGVPTRTPPRWNEISEVFMLALEPVWDGDEDASPQEALKKIKPDIDRMLEVSR